MTDFFFAGIGARKTPDDVLNKMRICGRILAEKGYVLRSGGAAGADEAFESGYRLGLDEKTGRDPHIFLPFRGFRKNPSRLFGSSLEARNIAKQFHPYWANVSNTGRDFHGRNVYQILGRDLKSPSKFVLCWTPNGEVVGGTGLALRIADYYDVPIFNFGIHTDEQISEFLLGLGDIP